MGYRTYIGVMLKKEYNKIKSMTRDQLIQHYNLNVEEDEGYLGMDVYDFGETLYEFGKYTDFNPPKGSTKTFFKNKELNKVFTYENELNIVTPEFLEYIIGTYEQRVKDYYNKMINPFLGKRDTMFESENPSTFLNSIKTVYEESNKYIFDFSLITEEEQTALFDIIEHIRTMRTEWTLLKPFDLKNGDEITKSWKYEYSIFELVRIYKSFDWKKNVMIYYGY